MFRSSGTLKNARTVPAEMPPIPLGRARIGCLLLVLRASSLCGASEGAALKAGIDRDRAAIGEPITLSVTAGHGEGVTWEGHSVADRLGDFDIEQMGVPVTMTRQAFAADPNLSANQDPPVGEFLTRWIFRLAAFDLGTRELPPLALRYTPAGGGEPASVSTPPFKIEIVPTVRNDQEPPADIRTGFLLSEDLRLWMIAAGCLLVGAGALYAGWRFFRSRPALKGGALPVAARAGPPYDRYLAALERLLAAGLLQSGRIKEFHVALAEIVKGYLGEIFLFAAVDRTTWEMHRDLAAARAASGILTEASAFLDACDLVKFAKHRPDTVEIDAVIARARRILVLAAPRAEAGTPTPSIAATPAGADGKAGEGIAT